MLRTLLTLAAVTAAGVAVGAAGWLAYTRLKETLVANFDALNAQIDGLGTALDDAIARIDADFQALRDQLAGDATDQAAVDAATAKLAASVDRLRAIDPDPNNPAPAAADVEAPAEPEQPAA